MSCSDAGGEASCPPRGRARAVLRIFRAELGRKFAAVGFLAPFAVVDWVGPDGTKAEVARTLPHKRSCRKPVWNYEGPGEPQGCRGAGKHGSTLEFQVFGESIGAWARGRPTFCGAVTVSLGELLGAGGEKIGTDDHGPGSQARTGPVLELQLQKRNEITGTITVQALLLHHTFAPSMEWLEEPMQSLCVGAMASIPSSGCGACASRQSSSSNKEPLVEFQASNRRRGRSTDEAMQVAPMGQELSVLSEAKAAHELSCASSGLSGEAVVSTLRKAPHRKTLHQGSKRAKADILDSLALTIVDAGNFRDVSRLGTSGGTAPFFRLVLGDDQGVRSPDYFIGKDLMRAEGEVAFYEQVLAINRGPEGTQNSLHNSGLAPLLSYMLEYAGVVECKAEGESLPMKLLVMRNLRDGCKCLRMLDVKIGERTADAGWQGKGAMSAFKQGLLDGLTTSQSEGFRVEGFDGAPPAFTSLDPLLDVAGLQMFADKDTKKKARRFMVQRMPASDIIMHLMDVHQEPAEPSEGEGPSSYAPTELAEIALHEMCKQLAGLSVACRRSPVPQKWVGSSVALGFEAGSCALRDVPEAELRKAVRVNIFDWGRSELNTPERHAELDDAARQDRATFWRYYVGGVDRLAWEVTRCYRHRFGCANGWRAVRLSIYDFDSLTENDFIGQITLPLQPTPDGEEVTMALADLGGRTVRTLFGPQATVTYRVSYREFPEGSRLQGAWRVSVVRAAALPGRDHLQGKSTSDPIAVLTSISQDGRFQFRQQTRVIERDLNPEWNETFEVPVASSPAALHRAFGETAPGLGTAPLGTLLPADGASDAEVDSAVQAWVARLDEAAANFSGGASEVATEGPVLPPPTQEPPRAAYDHFSSCTMQGLEPSVSKLSGMLRILASL